MSTISIMAILTIMPHTAIMSIVEVKGDCVQVQKIRLVSRKWIGFLEIVFVSKKQLTFLETYITHHMHI